MKNINGFVILFLFLLLGVITFFVTGILDGFDFFHNHETLTFIFVNLIIGGVYGIVLFFILRKK